MPDFGYRKILQTGEQIKYQDNADTAHGQLPRLIYFDGTDVFIGENTQTVARGIKVGVGGSASMLEIDPDGRFKIGANKRLHFIEDGISTNRTYQFPQRNTQLLGVLDAPPMGYTDYQYGGVIHNDPASVWGEGVLSSVVTYGATTAASLSSSGGTYRTYNTGTTVDTLAGERSSAVVTRSILNPILFAKIHIDNANVDTRWFFGFASFTDCPTNTDEPLANVSGVGFVINDGVTNGDLEFHINNGAATATKMNVATGPITQFDNTWNYYVIECNNTSGIDTATAYTWINLQDGTARETATGLTAAPSTTDVHTSASTKLGTGTSLRYHNVINNDSTSSRQLNIAMVHLVNRPSLDNMTMQW